MAKGDLNKGQFEVSPILGGLKTFIYLEKSGKTQCTLLLLNIYTRTIAYLNHLTIMFFKDNFKYYTYQNT